MPVPGRALTLQDLFNQLANNASEAIPLSSTEVLNQFFPDPEGLNINVSGSAPTFTVGTNYPVNIAGDYPTSYWRLAEAASTGTVYDSNQGLFSIYPRISSSSLTNITQGAASFYSAGKAASLTTAASSAITFANNSSLQITGDLSIELWINVSSFGTVSTNYSIIGKGVTGAGSTGEWELYILNSAGAGQLNFRQDNGNSTISATTNLASTSTWYHVVVTRVAATKTVTFYINGASAGSGTYTNTPTTTTGAAIIGAQGSYSTLVCSVTEVALYHKALTSTQVANHHNWGTASGVTATPYNGTGASYGLIPYPAYGTPTSDAYGASSSTWGAFVWQ